MRLWNPFPGHDGPPEKQESLWVLVVGPFIWAVHFLACYITAAVYCAKTTEILGLASVKWSILAYTLASLAGIGLCLWYGLAQHLTGVDEDTPHLEDTAGDRHRFIGFATALLCGLSAVATIYVAAAAWFFDSCY